MFNKYSKPYVGRCKRYRHQTEFQNYRQTFMLIYGPFGSGAFLSGSSKNSGNIGLLKSKSQPQIFTPCYDKNFLLYLCYYFYFLYMSLHLKDTFLLNRKILKIVFTCMENNKGKCIFLIYDPKQKSPFCESLKK